MPAKINHSDELDAESRAGANGYINMNAGGGLVQLPRFVREAEKFKKEVN
jgi:hypothetical protein